MKLSFTIRDLLWLVVVVALAVGLWFSWDYIPGTLRIDSHGYVFGTGSRRVNYSSGLLQAEESYIAGVPSRTTWYRPDGTSIASTKWDKEHGGLSYGVDDNGIVTMQFQVQYDPATRTFLANGEATLYNSDGSVNRITQYKNGVEIK
jgi:antitoxin component YwqK of YwqJK toxin-antitoxin module